MTEIQRIEEFKIKPSIHDRINALLKKTFGAYHSDKSYFHQLPSFRYLVWEDKDLIGHMGVEHRVINIGADTATIFGVVDICVSDQHQSKNIATTLLQKLEKLGKENHIDFLVLIAQNHALYEKNGFQLVNNTCRWLMINSNQTLGVGHRRIDRSLLIKPIGEKKWNPGLVDFLGHMI